MLTKILVKRPLSFIPLRSFSSGHHEEEHHYDWRDDPKVNKELEEDIRDRGWKPETYKFPYEGRDKWRFPSIPSKYRQDDLTMTLSPENKKIEENYTAMRSPYWDEEGDVAHEYDYESEDYDFQADSFKLQHFRKKFALTPYFIIAALPFIYFWAEFLYSHYPDEDYWKINHPPPLDFPDADDTNDTETYQDYNSKEGRYLVDTGIIDPIWYDIKDGKKIYKKFSGVNQPLPDL